MCSKRFQFSTFLGLATELQLLRERVGVLEEQKQVQAEGNAERDAEIRRQHHKEIE